VGLSGGPPRATRICKKKDYGHDAVAKVKGVLSAARYLGGPRYMGTRRPGSSGLSGSTVQVRAPREGPPVKCLVPALEPGPRYAGSKSGGACRDLPAASMGCQGRGFRNAVETTRRRIIRRSGPLRGCSQPGGGER
jgi:hypothetical protein